MNDYSFIRQEKNCLTMFDVHKIVKNLNAVLSQNCQLNLGRPRQYGTVNPFPYWTGYRTFEYGVKFQLMQQTRCKLWQDVLPDGKRSSISFEAGLTNNLHYEIMRLAFFSELLLTNQEVLPTCRIGIEKRESQIPETPFVFYKRKNRHLFLPIPKDVSDLLPDSIFC